jgi:hypothetical protein
VGLIDGRIVDLSLAEIGGFGGMSFALVGRLCLYLGVSPSSPSP